MNQAGLFCFVLIVELVLFKSCFSQASRDIQQKFTSHPNWKLLNVSDVCGRAAPTFVKKIVGGKDAKLGQFPWMAYLIYRHQTRLSCGGSIVNHRYIMTASHCGPGLARVRLGEYEYKYETIPTPDCAEGLCAPPSQDYNIEEMECHYFTLKNYFDDICLVRLDRDIQFNDFVKPICLPFYTDLQDRRFEGEYMEVAGWGSVNETMTHPPILQVIEVPIMSTQFCAEIWKDSNDVVVDTQICAEIEQEVQRDSCYKDSGGPLMKRLEVGGDWLYFQFGIVSWGDPKCEFMNTKGYIGYPWRPAVYTRVVSYLEWILDHIHE